MRIFFGEGLVARGLELSLAVGALRHVIEHGFSAVRAGEGVLFELPPAPVFAVLVDGVSLLHREIIS